MFDQSIQVEVFRRLQLCEVELPGTHAAHTARGRLEVQVPGAERLEALYIDLLGRVGRQGSRKRVIVLVRAYTIQEERVQVFVVRADRIWPSKLLLILRIANSRKFSAK